MSESKSHSWNDLMTESVAEYTSEMEIQTLNDSWGESASQLAIQSRCKSANHSQNESGSESLVDSLNDFPNVTARDGQILVRRSAPRAASGLESNTA